MPRCARDGRTPVQPIECLHYALNLPTSVVINGIDSMKLLEQAFQAASTSKPMSGQEVAALLNRTAAVAGTDQFEPFKTGQKIRRRRIRSS